jgi:hypothetical protein
MATGRAQRDGKREFDIDAFHQFVGDPDVGKAIEALKRANDIFDIIEPQETQHSQILQWLLNPREGHGQGDAIFKDFLTAAWENLAAYDGPNIEFFEHWTPARISLTGFYSILLLREYRIKPGNHLDFFIVDPVNRFVIVVENKYRAKHGSAQLRRYRMSVKELVSRHPSFRGFSVALIALDKGRSRNLNLPEMQKYWVYLDYSWLEAGASRAEAQLRRGNQSASLLISYCQRQSGYVPQAENEVDYILSRLAREYRSLLEPLADARTTPLGAGENLALNSAASHMWVFAQHHPELVSRLTRLKNLAFLKSEFERDFPSHNFDCEINNLSINVFDKAWLGYMQSDKTGTTWWPFHLRARLLARSSPGSDVGADDDDEALVDGVANGVSHDCYTVFVVYHEHCVVSERAARVHHAMVQEFEELASGRQSAGVRRIDRIKGVAEKDLYHELQLRYRKLLNVLQRA